jgi:hypothetical protein
MSARSLRTIVVRCDHPGCCRTFDVADSVQIAGRCVTLGWLREGVIDAKHWCHEHRFTRAS